MGYWADLIWGTVIRSPLGQTATRRRPRPRPARLGSFPLLYSRDSPTTEGPRRRRPVTRVCARGVFSWKTSPVDSVRAVLFGTVSDSGHRCRHHDVEIWARPVRDLLGVYTGRARGDHRPDRQAPERG